MLIAIKNSIARKLKINSTNNIWKSENAIQEENYKYLPLMPRVERDNAGLTVEEAFKEIAKDALNNNCRNHSDETTTRFRLYQYYRINLIIFFKFLLNFL